jgi:FAD/FMN-containing dehydrogenase
VLADGSVVSSLTKMLKDNAGYRWKDLLVGSEGTLGIITRAVLRLRPLPRSTQTALVAMSDFDCVPRLLRRLEARFAGQLSSFELMWNDFFAYVTKAQLQYRPQPMPPVYALYALIETLGGDPKRDMELFQEVLSEAQDIGLIEDAVIAQTAHARSNLWAVRDDLGEAMRPMQPAVAYDVSMALQDMPAFVDETKKALLELRSDATVLYYGHAGDGNLHLAVSLDRQDPDAHHKVDEVVYRRLEKLGGSVSGEHGIGTGKLNYIGITRSPEELALMRSIKKSLDPKNILNPGKILPATA